jgi:RNA-binding protein
MSGASIMPLTSQQRAHLRALAHHRDAVVIIGDRGLTENVLGAIDEALEAHELIKVRIAVGERDDRRALLERIAAATGSEQVQAIGRIAVLYRRAEKPRIQLP